VGQHRDALREREGGDEVAHLPEAVLENRLVIRLAFRTPIPADVVVVTVAVLLPVRFVVLLVVADEIVQRVAVVRRDEIDTRVRAAAARLIDVARSGQARRKVGDPSRVAAPEMTHRIAITTVPLSPTNRKVADLITPGSDVPPFSNELHARQRRVL